MTSFVEMRFTEDMLGRHQLPDIGYPVPADAFDGILGAGGALPFAMLLHWLQLRSEERNDQWRDDEPAMDRLAHLLAPADEQSIVSAAGENWWLEIGPVDLARPVIGIHRGEALLAAIVPREDGRLRVAAYRPLDAKSIRRLLGVALNPHPEHGVCMRANNWEYALDCSAAMGNFYAAFEGAAHLGYWDGGLGVRGSRPEELAFKALRNSAARKPAVVAVEIGVFYALHAD